MYIEHWGKQSNLGIKREIEVTGLYINGDKGMSGGKFLQIGYPSQLLATTHLVPDRELRSEALMSEAQFRQGLLSILLGRVGIMVRTDSLHNNLQFIYTLRRGLSGLLTVPLISTALARFGIMDAVMGERKHDEVSLSVDKGSMRDLFASRGLRFDLIDFDQQEGGYPL